MSYGNDAARRRSEPKYGAKRSVHNENLTRQRLRREIYGDDYPIDADARGYVTLTHSPSEARIRTAEPTERVTNHD